MIKEKVTKRIGSLIKLKPEYEERYIILHKHTFPGVLERIKKSNIRNYSIFLLDGILFSHYEYIGNDYKTDMNAIADDTTKEWWKLTDHMQEPISSRKEGEWWAEMELLQHFDEIAKSYNEVERHSYMAEIKPGSEDKVKDLFKEFNQTFIPLFKNAHIQNHNVFLSGSTAPDFLGDNPGSRKDERLYVYFEYTGENFEDDDKELNGKGELKKWNTELEKYLSVTWKEMNEVFHTD